ncbi:hypothetical protein [Anaeromicropila populeti]|uniref:ParG protein n=1 Tax=Anaeromicropila populeti TaxID=37658 RepID=A0A1I6LWV1_9FIRM|nr:hypothetical protein [Anaeromicropila populeti]SFS07854.1 hypothetical protein SAMN05661086_03623 [Anaeromicropila populeti]
MGFAEKEQLRTRKRSVVSTLAGVGVEEQIEGQESIETLEGGKYVPAKKDSIVVVPAKEESRSKRVNLLLKPSLYKKAKEKCDEMGISVNECINQLLEVWTQK